MFNNKVYSSDVPLYKKLGLPLWEIKGNGEVQVGEVIINEVVIDITVCCTPAQFYTFKLRFPNGKEQTVESGSGAMSDYWPFVEAMAQDMIVVK